MPPEKHPAIWTAKPHTIAKIAILRNYLFAWFQVMGNSQRDRDMVYIDGFAGPGEYVNYPTGSPVAALEAAKGVLENRGPKWVAGDVHCAFIERDPKVYKNLEERLEEFYNIPKLHIYLRNTEFVNGIAELRTQFHGALSGTQPLFVFIDPFGPTDVPFTTVAELLRSSRSEILINLDADGIDRIFHAGEAAKHEVSLDRIMPDASWRTLMSKGQSSHQRYRQVLNLYIKGLRNLPNVRYVFAFEMRSSSGTLNYYLVFASQHYRGLEKMKEAMKRIDQTGEYSFSDARIGQTVMLRFDDPHEHSQVLFRRFTGQRASYEELRDFALNETPFTNPKSMLKVLELETEKIRVETTDPKRRKGTFKEEAIKYIEFSKGD